MEGTVGLISLPMFVLLAFLIVFSMGFLFLISRVTELPIPHNTVSSAAGSPRALAIILSGIGGWIRFDQRLAETLAAARFDVIGIDSLRYFYQKKKTPAMLAQDLSNVMRQWLQEQKEDLEIVLVGYSKGADVLPFAVNLLEPELRNRIQLIALLGVGRLATFKIQLSDLLGRGRSSLFPVQVTPEIRKLENIPGLCIYGDKDRVSLCRNLKRVPSMEVKEIRSGPVFHDSGAIADIILTKYYENSPTHQVKPSTEVSEGEVPQRPTSGPTAGPSL
jgi:type IV secretory pathway VirJ component